MANLKATSHYYPFGLELTNKQYINGESYRYGFNGKENDREWGTAGLTQDYVFRLYNSGIVRFLSVDPLADSYPWNSTYAFAEGDVIRSIDLDGLEKLEATIQISIGNKIITGDGVLVVATNVYGQWSLYMKGGATVGLTKLKAKTRGLKNIQNTLGAIGDALSPISGSVGMGYDKSNSDIYNTAGLEFGFSFFGLGGSFNGGDINVTGSLEPFSLNVYGTLKSDPMATGNSYEEFMEQVKGLGIESLIEPVASTMEGRLAELSGGVSYTMKEGDYLQRLAPSLGYNQTITIDNEPLPMGHIYIAVANNIKADFEVDWKGRYWHNFGPGSKIRIDRDFVLRPVGRFTDLDYYKWYYDRSSNYSVYPRNWPRPDSVWFYEKQTYNGLNITRGIMSTVHGFTPRSKKEKKK